MEIIDIGKARVCVSATRINGRDYVDIRAHLPDGHGMLKPTPTGILLPVEYCSEVLAAAEHERIAALDKSPATFFYFVEKVEDKLAQRVVLNSMVSTSIKEAIRRTPTEYGSESGKGYIFKSCDYEIRNSKFIFMPSRPYAVWIQSKLKWVPWAKRKA